MKTSLKTWNTRKQYDKNSNKRGNFPYLFTFQLTFLPYFPHQFTIFFRIFQIFSLFNFVFFHISHIFSLFNLPFFQFRVFILTMSFSSAFIVCFTSTYSCWFRMFTLPFNYQYSYRNMQLKFVVSPYILCIHEQKWRMVGSETQL